VVQEEQYRKKPTPNHRLVLDGTMIRDNGDISEDMLFLCERNLCRMIFALKNRTTWFPIRDIVHSHDLNSHPGHYLLYPDCVVVGLAINITVRDS